MSLSIVDCNGLGGAMSLGFIQQGFELQYRCGTLSLGSVMPETNRHITGWSWDSHFSDNYHDWNVIQDVDVIVATPPCSGFSTMTRKDLRGTNADVNKHMWAFVNYAGKVAPKIAVMESVQAAYSLGKPLMRDLRAKLEHDTGKQYHLTHLFQNGLDHGGPANRPRYFLVMSQVPFGVELPEPDSVPYARDVLSDLTGLHETWEPQPYRAPDNWWAWRRRNPDGTVDGHAGRHSLMRTRIEETFEWTNGEWPQGDRLQDVLKRVYERYGALPPSWSTLEDKIVRSGFNMGINQPRRMSEDKLCHVITGSALDVTIHPTENRLITHREAYRIQGFPDAWRLWPSRDSKSIHKAAGKGVPVDAARWVAHWIKQSLEGNPGTRIGTPDGERETYLRADRNFKKVLERGNKRRHDFWNADYYANAGR